MQRVSDKIGTRPIRISTLCYHLNREFKSLSVRFRSKSGEFFSISGYFSPYKDYDKEGRYNVLISYEKEYPTITLDKEFCDELLLIMAHEFRHGQQFKRRDPHYTSDSKFKHENIDVQEEVRYLSEPCELDSYAFEAAYALKLGANNWTHERYKMFLGKYAPKLYNKFMKKVYLFSHK